MPVFPRQTDPPVGAWRGPDAPGMDIRDRYSTVLTEESVVRIRLDKLPPRAAHVMRVTEIAHWLEWQDWADPVLQQPYIIMDGLLNIPDAPGVGLEWNEDAVTAYRAEF